MEDKSEHIISLAKEIIDDIELSRLDAQSILLKSTRLTRYVDNEEIRKWLRFEMQGYSSKDEVSLNICPKQEDGLTKRKMKDIGYHCLK